MLKRPLSRGRTSSCAANKVNHHCISRHFSVQAVKQSSQQTSEGATVMAKQHPTLSRRPLLLVSDIDDTMVRWDSDRGFDRHTNAFKEFWVHNQSGGQCALVYNTGRSLEQYLDVWQVKGHVMPEPHALVCGVGTRIYSRSSSHPTGWEEDLQWTQSMNDGWNQATVVGVLEGLMKQVGSGNMQMGSATELHEHKFTFRVAPALATDVQHQMEQELQRQCIRYLLVINGPGDGYWHVIDVLPARGGKGNATEYVRQQYGLEPQAVVTAGDGPNDLTMLEMAHNAIAVGNASSQVRELAAVTAKTRSPNGHAASGKQLVQATQPACLGIIEGLGMLGFL